MQFLCQIVKRPVSELWITFRFSWNKKRERERERKVFLALLNTVHTSSSQNVVAQPNLLFPSRFRRSRLCQTIKFFLFPSFSRLQSREQKKLLHFLLNFDLQLNEQTFTNILIDLLQSTLHCVLNKHNKRTYYGKIPCLKSLWMDQR